MVSFFDRLFDAKLIDISSKMSSESTSDLKDQQITHKLGVPTSIQYTKCVGQSKVWNFFFALQKPYCKLEGSPYAKKRKGSPTKSKTFSNLCLMCLRDLDDKAPNSNAWKLALCNITNTSNAEKHLKNKHDDREEVIQFFDQGKDNHPKQNEAIEAKRSVQGLPHLFRGMQDNTLRRRITRWLIYQNIPFNVTQQEEFKEMIISVKGDYQQMARETFIEELHYEFKKFQDAVTCKLKEEEECIGHLPFLSISHDMWTTPASDNTLGVAIRFITKEFDIFHLSCALIKNNESHSAHVNASKMRDMFITRFKLDIDKSARYITSDTASAARAVADEFDETDQVDCELHLINLILEYGIGLRENTSTKQGLKTVVTPGGALPEGKKIIKTMRKIADFVNTPQRKEELEKIQKFYALPIGRPRIDGTTRIAYSITLIRTILFHYASLNKLTEKFETFDLLWSSITADEWSFVQEIEAVCSNLASYALSEAQNDVTGSARKVFYRSVCEKFLSKQSFKVLIIENSPDPINTMSDMRREVKKLDYFTAFGKTCLNRLKAQVDQRIGNLNSNDCMPVFLDPVTKAFATNIFQGDNKLYSEALKLAYREHLIVYRSMFKKQDTKVNVQCNINEDLMSEVVESNSDDDDFDIVLESVSNNDFNDEEEELKKSADAIFRDWLERKVDYKEFLYDEVEKKMSMYGASRV